MVVEVRIRCGGGADSGLGCLMDVEVGGYGRDRDRDVLSRWEDNLAHVTLGTEPNAPLTYAPLLEHHHPVVIILGDPGGRLDRKREIIYLNFF